MGLFSFLHKNKQDAASGKSEYRSQADEPFSNGRTRAKRNTGNAGNTAKAGKDNDGDPMLPEKKRARRRLIGAVVLVLAVVIVLPMILDPEPKPLTDDISVQIPSRDAKTPAAPAAAAAPSDASTLDAKEELVDAKPAVAADKPPAVKPAEKIAETPAAKPAAPPADLPPPVEKIAKPVEKPAEKVVDKGAEKAAEKAALAKAEKAEKAEKAAAAAAEAKRAAADKAAAKPSEEQRALAILQGKPADKSAAAKPADKPATYVPNGKFVIQVAALATQEKIDELRGKLTAAGISSYTQKVATKDGDRTRIRVGPFATREEADKARAKIVKLGLNATLVPT
ncbi:SPOR domain-containing protein [Oxalobacteraceae bacterium CAVE-383]|nr:SPOR domain-containing protein [Oxalobacteraceae bacterium CAVE-383]